MRPGHAEISLDRYWKNLHWCGQLVGPGERSVITTHRFRNRDQVVNLCKINASGDGPDLSE